MELKRGWGGWGEWCVPGMCGWQLKHDDMIDDVHPHFLHFPVFKHRGVLGGSVVCCCVLC